MARSGWKAVVRIGVPSPVGRGAEVPEARCALPRLVQRSPHIGRRRAQHKAAIGSDRRRLFQNRANGLISYPRMLPYPGWWRPRMRPCTSHHPASAHTKDRRMQFAPAPQAPLAVLRSSTTNTAIQLRSANGRNPTPGDGLAMVPGPLRKDPEAPRRRPKSDARAADPARPSVRPVSGRAARAGRSAPGALWQRVDPTDHPDARSRFRTPCR